MKIVPNANKNYNQWGFDSLTVVNKCGITKNYFYHRTDAGTTYVAVKPSGWVTM
jgi:hypothetical protein